MLDLAGLLRVPRVDTGFDISPDGTRLAFSWNLSGEWQIYEKRLGPPEFIPEENSPRPTTIGAGGKLNPRYSPDGTCLAYVCDFDGSENFHLFVHNYRTGTHTDLTPDISFALQPNFCWSPDGSQLAILSNQQGHFSAYIIASNGGETRLIFDSGHPAWQVEWSPDGKWLAVCCEMHAQDYGIFIVSLARNKVIQLSEYGKALNAHDPHWSPDSKKLAFYSDSSGWFDIGIYELASNQVIWLTSNLGDSKYPCWSDDSEIIGYTQSRGAVNWLAIVGKDKQAQTFCVDKGFHSAPQFTPDGKHIICLFSSSSKPPDLWMFDLERGTTRKLTNSLPLEQKDADFSSPEEIEYPGMDGASVPALLFRPSKTPAPAVVMIHGGPNWHYPAEWNPVWTHLASRGWVVLAPNYHGSTGYGREWQYAARFDLGGIDTRDCAAGAQYLIREGLAEAHRIAVTGRSHGGYLTMTCLTRYPELWAGGSAVVPFMNWFKTHERSREDVQHWDIENMGDPKDNYGLWYNHSPYFFLDRIKSPVQLICGGKDPRCPAADSIDARDKLMELGKSVELILYEDEGHAFLKPENILDSEIRRVEFLAKMFEEKVD